jgi:plasmid stability protein
VFLKDPVRDSTAVVAYSSCLQQEASMATLTIRDVDESLKRRLRLRAVAHNRSMQEEARQILCAALSEPVSDGGDFLARIRQRFAGLGDVLLHIEPREPVRSTTAKEAASS